MNYCTNCGSKLEKNNNFCTSCGSRIRKEDNALKPLLFLGIILVLFSSFVLGLFSWENMSSELKIGFFVFETILFFSLSFILKKAKSKLNRLFFVIGLILIPYTLSLVGYYDILSNYFHFDSLLNTYLAIIFFITFIIYLFVNVKFKSKFVDFISLICLLVSFINLGLIFSKEVPVILLLITCYSLIIFLLSFIKLFGDNMRFILRLVSSIIVLLIFPVLFASIITYSFDKVFSIINLITLIIYLLITYIKIYNGKTLLFKITSPFIVLALLSSYAICIFKENLTIIYSLISTISVALYFVSLLSKNKVYKTISLIIAYVTLFFILMITTEESYLKIVSLLISGIILLLNIFNILVSKYNKMHYLLPLSIFTLICNGTNYFYKFDFIYLALSAFFIYLIIYNILKIKNNSKSIIYLIATLFLSIISCFLIENTFDIVNLLALLTPSLLFIFSVLYREDLSIRIVSYSFFNFGALLLFDNFYNASLLVSSITILFSVLLMRYQDINLKPYILYSEILVFIITLFNTMSHSNLELFIGIIVFLASYMTVVKYYNYKYYRIPYIMVGLLTIIRIVGIIIEPVVISSIISILTLLIIVTIIYLMDIENKWGILLLSLVVLIPYYNLINEVFSNIYELYVLPFILYDLVLFEIINFKNEKTKKILSIVSLAILSFFMLINNNELVAVFINVIVSLIYILIGVFRKYNHYIYLGIVFLIISLYSQLMTVLDSTILMMFLIIIGFILITIVLVKEIDKRQ